ncbi:MAG TPA: LysR family transcriptional regulator [Steroidobacteraceae bacterium]
MDLRQLRYFLAVAELGSFTRAASAIGRTQQALSKGIQALEHQLGARLFERGVREARLTPVGRLLVDHARAADEAVRTFEERLEELQTGREGEVRIGTSPTTSGYLVAPAVLALRRIWPRIGVKVISGFLPDLLSALLAREVDVVVAIHILSDLESGTDSRIRTETLMHDVCWVVASAHHPLARQRNITLAQLQKCSWVLGSRHAAAQNAFRERFRRAGLEPPLQHTESTSLGFVRVLVHEADYLALLPTRLAQAELAANQWVKLDVPQLEWRLPIVAYTRSAEPEANPVQRMLQELRHAAAQALKSTGESNAAGVG